MTPPPPLTFNECTKECFLYTVLNNTVYCTLYNKNIFLWLSWCLGAEEPCQGELFKLHQQVFTFLKGKPRLTREPLQQ